MTASNCRWMALVLCALALAARAGMAVPIKVAPSATLPQPGVFLNERNPSADVREWLVDGCCAELLRTHQYSGFTTAAG